MEKISPLFQILEHTTEHSYHALIVTQDLKINNSLIKFDYKDILEKPNRFTLQVGENQHITFKQDYLKYLNHSCNPNIYIDLDKKELIAIKDIKAGEELSFFYPSTEWEMEEAFDCNCKAEKCLGKIKGAKYINKEILAEYKLSVFIKSSLK